MNAQQPGAAQNSPFGGALDRREFLRRIGISAAVVGVPGLLAACAPSAPAPQPQPPSTDPAKAGLPQASSNEPIKIGFIALTDCASVVMAQELGLFRQYGLNVEVVKQASWASTRDNLLTGEIQAAHCLFGMPFSVYTGVGGTAGKELNIAMMLNNNGQAITLAQEHFGGRVPYGDVKSVKAAVEALKAKKEVTFAMTFPGGTHDLWLRYWLAASGVDQKTVKIITVPPPQMVANMKVNNMDGYCVGEPWGGVAVKEGIGYTAITTQDMWRNHPEKALVVTPELATKRRGDLKLLMRAVFEASKYIDDLSHKPEVAKIIGKTAYVNANADVIDNRLQGKYDLGGGLGSKTYTDDTMLFYNDGRVNLPRKAHAAWFMAQYVRHGYLKELPDTKAIADKLILSDLYREVAKEVGVPIPDDDMAPFTIQLDNARFDPADIPGYLKKYGVAA